MSQFIGAALPQFIARRDNFDHLSVAYLPDEEFINPDNILEPGSLASPFWPRSSVDGAGGDLLRNEHWDTPDVTKGSDSRFAVIGVTRDAYGSAVGGVSVKLFTTAGDVLVERVVSDLNTGAYTVLTPFYPDTHYIVAHKTGTPNIAGATVNTLVGS